MHDKALIAAKLDRWENFMRSYHLPAFEELPDMPFYVDQIIIIAKKYLSFIPNPEADDPFITTSAVNNYVRMKLMPPPIKKRYGRMHLAYLIMICCLKQSLPMMQIKKILPYDTEEESIRETYNAFSNVVSNTALAFIQQVRDAAKIMNSERTTEREVEEFVLSAAVSSVLYCVFIEKLLRLPKKYDMWDQNQN